MSNHFDVAVIGAGAAGMMCAAVAGQRGKRVVLIDHATKLAEKIRISGGGRCNFTNIDAGPQNFLSNNPHFCRSALSRYTPQDFLALMKRHHIRWHEKHKGQLFCDNSAEDIIAMLRAECDAGGVSWRMPAKLQALRKDGEKFAIGTDGGELAADNVVIASGGLSIPKIGATDLAYRIARQFDIPVIEPQPALVPLTFDAAGWQPYAQLSGIAGNLVETVSDLGEVVRTDSVANPQTQSTEHFFAASLQGKGFTQAAFARLALVEGKGMAVVYSHRSYGEYSADTSTGWMRRNGEAIERDLMSWTGMPTLAQLRALPKAK